MNNQSIAELVTAGTITHGKGGTVIIETPIGRAASGVLKNGPRSFRLTKDMLDQMVENYTSWRSDGGAPVAGYFGHSRNREETEARRQGKEDPALHVLEIWRSDDTLHGRLEFQPEAWERIHSGGARKFRGLSIVFAENGKDLHGREQGPMLHNVDVVPEPFFPVEIAASADWTEDEDPAVTSRIMNKLRTEEAFLQRVDEVRLQMQQEETKKPVHERSSYGDAMVRASELYPEEYEAWEQALGETQTWNK